MTTSPSTPEQPRGRVHATAFLVGLIDTKTSTLRGVGLFSDETPSFGTAYFPFTVSKGYGQDYQEGVQDLASSLREHERHPDVAWVLPVLDARSRASLGL